MKSCQRRQEVGYTANFSLGVLALVFNDGEIVFWLALGRPRLPTSGRSLTPAPRSDALEGDLPEVLSRAGVLAE